MKEIKIPFDSEYSKSIGEFELFSERFESDYDSLSNIMDIVDPVSNDFQLSNSWEVSDFDDLWKPMMGVRNE